MHGRLKDQGAILPIKWAQADCNKLIYVFVYPLNIYSLNPYYMSGTFLNFGNKRMNATGSTPVHLDLRFTMQLYCEYLL